MKEKISFLTKEKENRFTLYKNHSTCVVYYFLRLPGFCEENNTVRCKLSFIFDIITLCFLAILTNSRLFTSIKRFRHKNITQFIPPL